MSGEEQGRRERQGQKEHCFPGTTEGARPLLGVSGSSTNPRVLAIVPSDFPKLEGRSGGGRIKWFKKYRRNVLHRLDSDRPGFRLLAEKTGQRNYTELQFCNL